MRGVSVRAGLIALMLATSATAALAAGFALREQSAEGQGSSFAGVAAGTNGLSSMFWNPATIVLHDGFNSESNVSLVLPSSRAKNAVGGGVPPGFEDTGNIGVTAIVPASYYTYQVNEMIFLGLGTTAPFGLETENRRGWAGALHGTESEIFSINVNPNIALKINDQLAIAVGLQAEYFEAKLRGGAPVSGAPLSSIKGDDIDIGFTAGILFQPTDTTQIGLGFRSSIDHTLDGRAIIIPLGFGGSIKADVETPELVTFGVRQDVSDSLTLLAGVEWANWSRIDNLNVVADLTGATVALTPLDWDDSWFFSIGAEYRIDEKWTLRAGFAYEDSGIPTATRTPRLPDNDRYWLSVGASYQLYDWLRANVAYSHVFMDDDAVNLAPGTTIPPLPGLTATYEQSIDIISASATIDW
jgi:long-chain fatty acid transport protein